MTLSPHILRAAQYEFNKLNGLGNAPPLVFFIGKRKRADGTEYSYSVIAEPDTTLEANGDKKGRAVDWTCNDYIIFHKAVVRFLKEGRMKSGTKFSDKDALATANQVFRQHWDKARFALTRCGFTRDFYVYFNQVGLASIFNIAHRTSNAAVDKTARVVDSVTETGVKLIDSGGNLVTNVAEGASNIAGGLKWILPVAIGGVVLFVGAYAYKNFIKGDGKIAVPGPGGVPVRLGAVPSSKKLNRKRK